MFDASLLYIQEFLFQYGAFAVFLLGFLEEIFFFIPSSFLFIALGFLMIDSQVTAWSALGTAFWHISLVTSAGVTIGALAMYGFTYWGGKPLIERYGKYARVSWKDVERISGWFERGYRDEAVLVFFRAIPVFPITVVSIVCGLIRIPFREFVWTTFIGTILRVCGLAFTGWYAGREYERYAATIAGVEQYTVLVCIFAALIFVSYFHVFRRSKHD